jgi:hypothetical protein
MNGPTHIGGRIIFDFRNGSLNILPIADSDGESAALIGALREMVVSGDLLALLERAE